MILDAKIIGRRECRNVRAHQHATRSEETRTHRVMRSCDVSAVCVPVGPQGHRCAAPQVSVRLFEFGDVPIGFFPYWLDDVNNIFQYQVPSGLWLPKHWVRD